MCDQGKLAASELRFPVCDQGKLAASELRFPVCDQGKLAAGWLRRKSKQISALAPFSCPTPWGSLMCVA